MKSYFSKFLLVFCLLLLDSLASEMFWEINGTKGGKVYILGSLEIGERDLFPLNPEINKAFDRSNYLILQLNKGDDNEAFMHEEMYVKARFEDNDSIRNHITPQTYAQVRMWLKEHKLSSSSLDQFQPWVVGLTLESLDMALWGGEKLLNIENYFYKKARRNGKGVYALERISEAFLRLQGEDDDFQETLLQSFMDRRVSSEKLYHERFVNYREGNISYLEKVLVEPLAKHPMIKELVYDEQNRVYANKIKLYMKNKRGREYFLIIDLEHLLGDDGVLAQLNEAGIAVKAY